MATVIPQDLGQDLVKMARLVQSQLVSGMTAFFQRDVGAAKKVSERDDQVDNLLAFLEERCFQRIPEDEAHRGLDSRRRRGVLRVAVNLEKLGDFAVNIAEQAVHVASFDRSAPPFDLASPTRIALAALDEVMYDARRDTIHFIDVHRSGPGDYALDIGVFVVSSLRSPVQDPALMEDLERINRLVVDFAGAFARQSGDTAFPMRLELSQARSFITSARLVTDPEFARELYLRGVQGLERVATCVP